MRRRHPVVMGAVALLVSAIVLSGCGGGTGSASISAGFIARSAASTSEQDTARIAMTMEISGEKVEIDGAMAMDGSAFEMSFAVPGGGDIEERVVDGVMYMRMPGSATEFGTEWVSIDMSGLLPEQQEQARSSNGADPTSSLQSLAGADGEVQTLGEDELRGGTATHYRVRIDADTALQRLRDGGVEPSARQIEAAAAMDGEPMDVWIGEGDRMLKMAFTMHLPQGSARVLMELYDFGTPIDIQAPPASETTDVTDRMRAQLTV